MENNNTLCREKMKKMIYQFYEENKDFHIYVDRYCKFYQLTVAEALKHNLVHATAIQYGYKERR